MTLWSLLFLVGVEEVHFKRWPEHFLLVEEGSIERSFVDSRRGEVPERKRERFL